jgi:type VI secretion system protein VasG
VPEISRSALFSKLNTVAFQSIESATAFCKLRGNPYVELAHWFHQLLQLQDSDVHRIVAAYDLNLAHLARDLTAALDRLPRGATSISDLSSHVEEAVERGWVYATLMFRDTQVRSGYLIVGILKTPGLRNALPAMSPEFDKIKLDDLCDQFAARVKGSPEDQLGARDGSNAAAPGEATGAIADERRDKQQALEQFSIDLTERARQGELDAVVGRDNEIRQLVDILMRRRQNNPILTGEAGVGKTAVVEGFAARIANGDVPPALKDVALRVLDVGLLQAGASMKGEFEQRLRQVIDEVQASPTPIILFIDEAHTLIGAGGAAGTGDAANLLKPALARGTLRTIAATTWAEYKKYIEKDPALTRRFQVVHVNEPGEDQAVLMMRGVVTAMEQHHRVQVLDEAVAAAVKLSHRYIPARQLPDKSVSLLDTACARVAVSQHAVPAAVEDKRRSIEALRTELEIIEREGAIGLEVADRPARINARINEESELLRGLEARWTEELALVERILSLRARLRDAQGKVDEAVPEITTGSGPQAAGVDAGGTDAGEDNAAMLKELRSLQEQLRALQGERPLILPSVDAQAVASVVADWTGIPVGRMVKNEVDAVMNLAVTLEKRVIGQRHALEMITGRVQTSRANLDNPNKPVGVFLLAGSSGVGKTETGLALAEALYGGEQNIISINMSEFQEAHTVSTLKGAPPGYVGYGEGGILTEAVRRRPYSVVLLDEVEKAHADVHEIFFQVFDKGWMEDAEGRYIDFRNTLILLTTNVGTDLIMGMCRDPELMPEPDGIAEALREPLLKVFPPALLGRLVVIPYYPLSDDTLTAIIRLQLDRIKYRMEANHGVDLLYDEAVVNLIASRCREVDSGARIVDAILTNTLLPRISQEFLMRLSRDEPLGKVQLSVEDGEFCYAF